MTYTLPNTITNGDDIDATPVQGNFASIANEIVNIEAAQVTDQADIDALQATVNVGGWVTGPSDPVYVSADGPTQVWRASTNLTNKLYPGVRLKYQQSQAIQNYWSFDTNSADSKGSATMANIGTPTYTAGKFGNALTLNGTNQALSITDNAAFQPTGEFTIGCWFKTSTADRDIFQSSSANTNNQGINLRLSSTGKLAFWSSANSVAIGSTVEGTTTVTDGNFHYVVVSIRNNFTQIYLDGKLEASGYTVTPSYAATNYVRIGCANTTGSNIRFFNGQIDDLFLINGYALDEQTIAAKYAQGTAQGTGDLTLTKYALVTASSYSAPNTTVTIYSGTDHAMMNSTISNAYYSTQDCPYGFPQNMIGQALGSALVTSGQTGITSDVDLTGASIRCYVPATAKLVKFFVKTSFSTSSGNDLAHIDIYDGTTIIDSFELILPASGIGYGMSLFSMAPIKPGMHTFKLTARRAVGSGTLASGKISFHATI